MTSMPLDPRGDAGRALATAVEDFGPRALSNPVILANLFKDLLPDSPRETTVLVAVAEAGLAKAITDRIEQGLPPETATYQAATMVAEARALDPAAVRWAARQFATVLGYPVAPSDAETGGEAAFGGGAGAVPLPGWPPPVPVAPTQLPPPPAATQLPPPPAATQLPSPSAAMQGRPPAGPLPTPAQPTALAGPIAGAWGAAGWVPDANPGPPAGAPPANAPQASAYGAAPPPGSAGWGAPGQNPTGGWSPQGPAGWSPPQGGATGLSGPESGGPGASRPGKSRTPWYLGGAAIVAVIAAIVVVVAVSGGGKGTPSNTTAALGSSTTAPATTAPANTATTEAPTTEAPTTGAPTTAAPTTVASLNLTAAEAKLARVMPIDLDPNTDCQTQTDLPAGLVNLSAALGCTGPPADGADPGLPGGDIFGYQFPTAAAFQAGVSQYNKDKGFDPTTAGTACPPPSATGDGYVTWNNPSKTLGGDLECFTVANPNETPTMPVYIWTITSANTIVEAVGTTTTTFAALNSWFLDHNSPR